MIVRLLCAITLSLISFVALADVNGEDDRKYQIAKSAWLSGQDDLGTLRQFSALASSGNLAAQLTLGLVERQPHTYFHALKDLDHKKRRRLTHKYDGRFGKSWLKAIASQHPLAALLSQNDIQDYPAYATALADAGQLEMAYGAANMPLNMDNDDVTTLRLLSHPKLLPITKASIFAYAEMIEGALRRTDWVTDTEASEARANALRDIMNELPPLEFKDRILTTQFGEHIRITDLSVAKNVVRMRGAALLHHPDLLPLTDILKDVCPNDTEYHMGVLYHLTRGVELRLKLVSPLEPMITTDEWLRSNRFRGDLLRSFPSIGPRLELYSSLSRCFTLAVEAEH